MLIDKLDRHILFLGELSCQESCYLDIWLLVSVLFVHLELCIFCCIKFVGSLYIILSFLGNYGVFFNGISAV